MTVLAPALAVRVAKLIPLLSSDKDGEVVATARAIERILRAARVDWHALARAIQAPPTLYRGPPNATEPQTWGELAAWCRNRSHRLNEREREFVEDMTRRLVFGGEPTERQAAWLRAIFAKLRRAEGSMS